MKVYCKIMYASCVKQRFVAALIHDYLNYKPFEKYLLRLNKIRCLILQKKKKENRKNILERSNVKRNFKENIYLDRREICHAWGALNITEPR